jgi:hypothetical protein
MWGWLLRDFDSVVIGKRKQALCPQSSEILIVAFARGRSWLSHVCHGPCQEASYTERLDPTPCLPPSRNYTRNGIEVSQCFIIVNL